MLQTELELWQAAECEHEMRALIAYGRRRTHEKMALAEACIDMMMHWRARAEAALKAVHVGADTTIALAKEMAHGG